MTDHTIQELYDHRAALFCALVTSYAMREEGSFEKSGKHADGTKTEEGFFIALANFPWGQISYHLEDKWWDLFPGKSVEQLSSFNGHDSKDVLDCLGDIDIVFGDIVVGRNFYARSKSSWESAIEWSITDSLGNEITGYPLDRLDKALKHAKDLGFYVPWQPLERSVPFDFHEGEMFENERVAAYVHETESCILIKNGSKQLVERVIGLVEKELSDETAGD